MAVGVPAASDRFTKDGAAAGEWVEFGPPGGEIRVVAADPRNPGVLYAGAYDGTVLRRALGEQRWTALAPPSSSPVVGLLIDGRLAQTVYAPGMVARALNGAGVPTPQGGKRWSDVGVRTIASNDVYIAPANAIHELIVGRRMCNQVQRELDKRTRG